jgi:hypothetical protein
MGEERRVGSSVFTGEGRALVRAKMGKRKHTVVKKRK